MTLTVDKLLQTMRDCQLLASRPVINPTIRFVPSALAETDERLFPASKHRSKRIRKKLIKLYGGEFRKKPTMWQVGNTIYAHPSFKAQLREMIPTRSNDMVDSFAYFMQSIKKASE